MVVVTLEEMKNYLLVDFEDDDVAAYRHHRTGRAALCGCGKAWGRGI